MVDLNAISETALITLKARVIEAEKTVPLIHDRRGREVMDRLGSLVSEGIKKRVLEKKLKPALVSYLALRARRYDAYTRTFLEEHPGGRVISLGSGFDTRYWRISDEPWDYTEVDLPEVIAVKKEVLGKDPGYEMIGCSVLDDDWIEQVSGRQKQNVLFLAEGLLMYLREADAIGLIKKLAMTFSESQLVFEIIHRKYTKGFRKRLVESKIKGASGTMAGESYRFGLGDAREIESYMENIRVVDEWSYFEDPDLKPRFLRILRHFRSFARTQWTIRALIE